MQQCPKCRGERIVMGEITGDGENCYVVFRPAGHRFWSLTLKWGVRLAQEAFACRDCGLTWGFVEPSELATFVDRHSNQRQST
jgi:hypothetical protein